MSASRELNLKLQEGGGKAASGFFKR